MGENEILSATFAISTRRNTLTPILSGLVWLDEDDMVDVMSLQETQRPAFSETTSTEVLKMEIGNETTRER
jgi:hypothetical protein